MAGDHPNQKIYCAYDEEGVFVYQAFTPKIVEFAVKEGAALEKDSDCKAQVGSNPPLPRQLTPL